MHIVKLLCDTVIVKNAFFATAISEEDFFVFQSTIKHGDILLNRVQKLSRVINI